MVVNQNKRDGVIHDGLSKNISAVDSAEVGCASKNKRGICFFKM